MSFSEPIVPGFMLHVPNGHVVSVGTSELAARELARDRGYDDKKLELKPTTLVRLSHAMGLKVKTNPKGNSCPGQSTSM